jgi:Zn-dependent metalloprotease
MRRRHSTLRGLLALVVTLVLVLGFPISAGAAPGGGTKEVDPGLVTKLVEGARGSVKITVNDATNFASFIVAGRNGDLLPALKAAPEGKAKGFLKQFGAILGVADADADLVQVSSDTDAYGGTHITYAQQYRGLAVFGAVLKVHLDAAGNLTAVNGTIVPAIGLATKPKLSADEAAAAAIAAVVADPPGGVAPAGALRASSTELFVYRTGLIRGHVGTNELVYQVVVTNGASVKDAVFVHAVGGNVINRYTLVDNALDRVLYEASASTLPIWEEGDPFPGSLNVDQQNIVSFSGDTYRFFFNAFGRDSYDDAGAQMRSVNNDPTIACPNANWNGSTTNYCTGVTGDDTVAHEWGHAYTEYTNGLIYQWQPGALNESYSDIWGEVVDLLNGAGKDSPGTARAVGLCAVYTLSAAVVINAPASIAQTCEAGTASFGPELDGTGVTGDLVLANDGVAPGSDACTALPVGSMTSKIGLIDRGSCAFTIKVKNAQDAGAIGVVVADNVAGGVSGMGGTDATITIPSLRITLAKGNEIKGALGSDTVNVTLKLAPDPTSEDSYRWLSGEDDPAFGGAIRDMWTPTCYGDPGKVSDIEYFCDSSDSGGVHSNSGVPNHGFALLVDGGTYNDVTVAGIGLTKAAHLYWLAQTMLTPASKFEDHANTLEAACTTLIGEDLEGLSTGAPAGPSGQVISAADCVEVSDMIAAVELRTDPTDQCNFQPLLGQNPPGLCANGKDAVVSYMENFEDGLAGWTLSNQGVFAGWPGTNWAQDTSLPGGRAGAAAFAADLDGGNCDGGAGDISGVMRLESPPLTVPSSASLSKLTFQHYVATEAGWDGGNLKISINGGLFVVVPASAFIFNPYNGTLQTAGAGNTNPLAGEPGFTGTDGGELTGTWGESQVDLKALGLKSGDTFRLRFEFGADGCTGNDGWYVDDVTIMYCNQKKKP